MWDAIWEFGENIGLYKGANSFVHTCPYCKHKDSVVHARYESFPLDIGTQQLLLNPTKTPSPMICKFCKRPQPHMDGRTYGLSYFDIQKRIQLEKQLTKIWGSKKPLWTIS